MYPLRISEYLLYDLSCFISPFRKVDMVSSSEDPESGPGTGDEAGEDGRGKVDGSGQPTQQQQRSWGDRGQGEKVTTGERGSSLV